MAPPVACAKITLNYPVYAADFDPQNNGFLLVGGGGGEGRSGVGNKITLLNTSRKEELSEVVDIDLSRDEDSVTSLAYAQSTDTWATAYAGINSSTTDQNRGKNEHLRSFLLVYPPRRRADADGGKGEQEKPTGYKGETQALGRVSMFAPSTAQKKETFQRVLRLSQKRKDNGPRMGAVATGLAPAGEIVIFVADTSRPGTDDIRGRISLGEGQEAADVDITGLDANGSDGDRNFRIAYCTDYDVYVTDLNYAYNREIQLEPQCIHQNPHPDVFASSKARAKFRCVRFLTPSLLLVLQNLPNGKGSELLLLEISGMITLRKRLHKKIKSATGLSIAALPFAPPSTYVQHVIAIAGADTSITILTLDHPASSPYGTPNFRSHLWLQNVHPLSITSLAFSTHTPPTTPWTSTPPHYLKLASTSIAYTCTVHTLPLTPDPPPKEKDSVASYLLSAPGKSSITQNTFSVLIAILAIAIGAFFLQAFTEIRGGTPEYLGAKGWLSESVHSLIAQPYIYEDGVSGATSTLSSAAQKPLSHVSEAVETPFSHVSEAVRTPLNAVSSAAESSLSHVSQAVEIPLESLSSATSDASRTIGSLAQEAQQTLGLRELLARRNIGSDTSDAANEGTEIIVRHHPREGRESALSAHELTDAKGVVEGETAKRWEELEEHEKEGWKRKMLEAGEWVGEEAEAVLKGVLFSGMAGAVGGMVGGG